MNLQPLFDVPIVEQRASPRPYGGPVSDIFLVTTTTGRAVVRASRTTGAPVVAFWFGFQHLFGLHPRSVFDLAPLNRSLGHLTTLAIPQLQRTGVIDGRDCIVVDYLSGTAIEQFSHQPERVLWRIGRSLAEIHQASFPHFGDALGRVLHPIQHFPARLSTTIQTLVARFYSHDPAIMAVCERMAQYASRLPPPSHATYIMVDIDPSQFLADDEYVTGLVDTEAYVRGPVELDFIGLEYVLDARSAATLAAGYQSLRPLPDLRTVRPVYRYLYRLCDVQAPCPLDEWLSWPEWFDA